MKKIILLGLLSVLIILAGCTSYSSQDIPQIPSECELETDFTKGSQYPQLLFGKMYTCIIEDSGVVISQMLIKPLKKNIFEEEFARSVIASTEPQQYDELEGFELLEDETISCKNKIYRYNTIKSPPHEEPEIQPGWTYEEPKQLAHVDKKSLTEQLPLMDSSFQIIDNNLFIVIHSTYPANEIIPEYEAITVAKEMGLLCEE
ncbi:hypothetical protein K9M74_01685 [Candidatus Woesearchaeota archaeon]|nr:hypothetical protein [Candidatus Woesearchaeota archaeon]